MSLSSRNAPFASGRRLLRHFAMFARMLAMSCGAAGSIDFVFQNPKAASVRFGKIMRMGKLIHRANFIRIDVLLFLKDKHIISK